MSGKETRTSAGRRRGPMGHGGHGMPGEKAKDFRGTMKKLAVYLGAYKVPLLFVVIFAIGSTIFNIVGPKILGRATTEIFNGLVGKISGGADRQDIAAVAGAVRVQCVIFICPGIYYDRSISEVDLPDAKGDLREDQPYADELFR